VKSGAIVDLDRAEQRHPPRGRCGRAHGRADGRLLIVNLSAGRFKSDIFTATIDLGGQEVEEADLKKVLSGRRCQQSLRQDRASSIRCPSASRSTASAACAIRCRMSAMSLGVDMHVLTGERTALKNLELSINRAHLSVEHIVATPYASAALPHSSTTKSSWAALHRHGRRHDDDLGVCRGQARSHRCRQPRRHHVTTDLAQGPFDPHRGRRAAEGRSRFGNAEAPTSAS
jgi:cell division protein FtsA